MEAEVVFLRQQVAGLASCYESLRNKEPARTREHNERVMQAGVNNSLRLYRCHRLDRPTTHSRRAH